MPIKRILYASSEALPLIKTGGLADVSGSLPPALRALRLDIRLVLPAYRQVLENASNLTLASLLNIGDDTSVRIFSGILPGTKVKLWLIDSPYHFDRKGGPYVAPEGKDWPDNAERFTIFARAIELIALNEAGLYWQPDIVHCNDWQTGLVPALLAQHKKRPATVFTIHNLAYQGLFSADTFNDLSHRYQLAKTLWSADGIEFFGSLSLIKGGLSYADMLNTVSPTYAKEIRSSEFGYGLEGLLNYRSDRLQGILNGADYHVWDPKHDSLIAKNYDSESLDNKLINKNALQSEFGLPLAPHIPVIGMVGRLVEQKGCDLVLSILPDLIGKHDVQLIVLGTGDPLIEEAFQQAATWHPDKIAVHIGFNEQLAHLVEGGADMFLMPSRFEPCGLNQIYSLRYGTIPIVRRTGGLADTVISVTHKKPNANMATGFLFDEAEPQALLSVIKDALTLFQQPQKWRQIMKQGMSEDFSWDRSAKSYLALYEEAQERNNSGKASNESI